MKAEKRKLLYVGHPYHLKTHSVDFLKESLAKVYDIDYLAVADNCSLPEDYLLPFKGRQYAVCLCFQIMPSVAMLRKYVSFEHGVFFPMADYYYGMLAVGAPIWEEYRDFRIFSFSKKVHGDLVANGYDSTYIQYFPVPVDVEDWGDPQSVFFWQRLTHLNVYTVLEALKGFPIKHLRLHISMDPGEQRVLLPSEFQNGFGVSYSTWYDTREEMLRDMDRYAVYFAPRKVEGIGLSYLEAMARGRCVIANRETTHDEYITDGETGFLYDLNSPDKNINLSVEAVKRVQRNAQRYIKEGYAEWVKVLAALPGKFELPVSADPSKAKPCQNVAYDDPAAFLKDPTRFMLGKRGASCKPPMLKRVFRKLAKVFRCNDPQWECIANHKIAGIPFVQKYVRCDQRKEKTCILGIPVFTAEIIDA